MSSEHSLLLFWGVMIKINKLIKINFVFRKMINAIKKKNPSQLDFMEDSLDL